MTQFFLEKNFKKIYSVQKNDAIFPRKKFQDFCSIVNNKLIFWNVSDLPALTPDDTKFDAGREDSPPIQIVESSPEKMKLREIPSPPKQRKCSDTLSERNDMQRGSKSRPCDTGHIDESSLDLPKFSLSNSDESDFVIPRMSSEPKVIHYSYLDLPKEVFKNYAVLPVNMYDPSSQKWMDKSKPGEIHDGIYDRIDVKQKAAERKNKLRKIRDKLRKIKSGSINSRDGFDFEIPSETPERENKRKNTFEIIMESSKRLDHHTDQFNVPSNNSEDNDRYGDPFARIKMDMSKKLDTGLRPRDRSPLVDDSVEISRRPSKMRSLTGTSQDSLYESGEKGMEDYSRLRADLEKPIDSSLTLPKRSDNTYESSNHYYVSNNYESSGGHNLDYEYVECPPWWDNMEIGRKESAKSALKKETKITEKLIVLIVNICGRDRTTVEQFLRWWFYSRPTQQNLALNHLNIRTTKALRTRSAQPPDYRYGLRGEEDMEDFGRTRRELNKKLDTSLNMSRHTNNRLIN